MKEYNTGMNEFSGVKVALILNDSLITIQRDNKPDIRWPNLWELPGGGRENDETPEECAIREIQEELGLKLDAQSFIWKKQWPAMHDPSQLAWFLVAKIKESDVAAIKLGDEGRAWKIMRIEEFLSREDAVPLLKPRLQDYLNHNN